MEDKRYLPFKIAHLVLMSLTIIVTLVGMIQMARKFGTGIDGVLVIRLISSVVRIAGMVIGIIYLVSGYKKSSAKYYKLFFCLMTIALFFRQMVFVTNKVNTAMMIGGAVTIILSIVLTLGKDLGRNVSFAILALMIIIEVLLKFPISISDISIGQLGGELSMFMLFGTAGFMIAAKYIDKSLRGSN